MHLFSVNILFNVQSVVMNYYRFSNSGSFKFYQFYMNNGKSIQMFAIRFYFAFGILMVAIKWYAYYLTGLNALLSEAAESASVLPQKKYLTT